MLRAAAWTGGLFAVGAGVMQLAPAGSWIEPVVLAALGAALFLAGGRRATPRPAREAGAGDAPAGVPAAGRAVN